MAMVYRHLTKSVVSTSLLTIPLNVTFTLDITDFLRNSFPLSMLEAVYVCMVITYSKSMDQPGKFANPARG